MPSRSCVRLGTHSSGQMQCSVSTPDDISLDLELTPRTSRRVSQVGKQLVKPRKRYGERLRFKPMRKRSKRSKKKSHRLSDEDQPPVSIPSSTKTMPSCPPTTRPSPPSPGSPSRASSTATEVLQTPPPGTPPYSPDHPSYSPSSPIQLAQRSPSPELPPLKREDALPVVEETDNEDDISTEEMKDSSDEEDDVDSLFRVAPSTPPPLRRAFRGASSTSSQDLLFARRRNVELSTQVDNYKLLVEQLRRKNAELTGQREDARALVSMYIKDMYKKMSFCTNALVAGSQRYRMVKMEAPLVARGRVDPTARSRLRAHIVPRQGQEDAGLFTIHIGSQRNPEWWVEVDVPLLELPVPPTVSDLVEQVQEQGV